MSAVTSPVKAPQPVFEMFWMPTAISVPFRAPMTAPPCTLVQQMTTSTFSVSKVHFLNSSHSSMALALLAGLLFQLPPRQYLRFITPSDAQLGWKATEHQ